MQRRTKILYMYNVTKLNLFADAPVRQSGNSVNAHELLIMALFNFALSRSPIYSSIMSGWEKNTPILESVLAFLRQKCSF